MPSNPRLFRYTRGNLQALVQNAAHQFAAQHALSIYAADAIYSFIPKNACSTMRYTLAIANGWSNLARFGVERPDPRALLEVSATHGMPPHVAERVMPQLHEAAAAAARRLGHVE